MYLMDKALTFLLIKLCWLRHFVHETEVPYLVVIYFTVFGIAQHCVVQTIAFLF